MLKSFNEFYDSIYVNENPLIVSEYDIIWSLMIVDQCRLCLFEGDLQSEWMISNRVEDRWCMIKDDNVNYLII